jgi:hypothetical protein
VSVQQLELAAWTPPAVRPATETDPAGPAAAPAAPPTGPAASAPTPPAAGPRFGVGVGANFALGRDLATVLGTTHTEGEVCLGCADPHCTWPTLTPSGSS